MIKLPGQQGVALITALLVVSLATVLAVSLVSHLYYDIRRTENILRLDQAQLYNSNAVEFAMVLLKLDRDANNEYDSLEDIRLFNEQTAIFPVEGGSVSANLADLQSCFNLNNLSKTNTELARYRAQYISLLNNLGVDISLHSTLTDSLIDWLDKDDINEAQGAEFDYYIGLEKPYRTANSLMTSPSELRLVKGYTDGVIELIKDETCVLPAVNTAININTASSKMLESIEELKSHAEQIIKDRDGEADNDEDDVPFEKIDDFKKYVSETLKVKNFESGGLQIYSEYFLLESKTQLGAGDIKLFSMIYRDNSNAKTSLIRQTSGAF
ncbi:MAG: hypothetical protein DIZ80_09025 [endosymbiont of Galathealinum brachiosum]|uniref:Type II secretion system protein K n=1 Tax=endosymbiont of Galathealinum brachiosum TaxID=2200906 RepID=A0A370DC10_9GAMM|nr:MAG: hypothetical protein DIZ80_09025 [endosymbiont of Galathealinum brachiosum]